MKRIIGILFTICLVFSISKTAFAESQKIVFIDSQKILYETQAGKDAYKQLSAIKEQKAGDLEKKQDKLKKMSEQLQVKSATMSSSAREELESKYNKEYRDYQLAVKDAEEELRKKEMSFLKPFTKDLDEIIKSYCEKNGVDLVFDKQHPALIYGGPKYDITNSIISAFDKFNKEKKDKDKAKK